MKTETFRIWATAGSIAATILVVVAAGSSTTASGAGNDASIVAETKAPTKGGPQLWAENCARCHNYRSPTSYSNAQWEVVMQHMRVRANLTAEEYTKIMDFLKSAKK